MMSSTSFEDMTSLMTDAYFGMTSHLAKFQCCPQCMLNLLLPDNVSHNGGKSYVSILGLNHKRRCDKVTEVLNMSGHI